MAQTKPSFKHSSSELERSAYAQSSLPIVSRCASDSLSLTRSATHRMARAPPEDITSLLADILHGITPRQQCCVPPLWAAAQLAGCSVLGCCILCGGILMMSGTGQTRLDGVRIRTASELEFWVHRGCSVAHDRIIQAEDRDLLSHDVLLSCCANILRA